MLWRLTFLITVCLYCAGCSRAFYRHQSDAQVAEILDEKIQDPRWWLPRTSIKPDYRSRFYNSEDPDCPPLTPDDPAADFILQHPSGFAGAKLWRRLPQSGQFENPQWPDYLSQFSPQASDVDRALPNLTMAQAVELSLIHSREYQGQLENLYLAALALTFERYRFQVRPFVFAGDPDEANSGIFYQHQPDDQSIFGIGSATLGFTRLFPSGAQLVGELVNNTIWLFTGPNGSTSATSLGFSLIQPLMRGASREIVLEELTQSERNVLYAVRDFARFRKLFFVSTITGGQVAGLQRFLRGFEFLAGGGSAANVGYFPVLLQLQQLRNRQYIVRTLEYIIDDLRAAGGDDLDIASLKSTLADTRGDLFRDERVFQDRLDQYKVQLGLPPDMNLTLSDALLEPFEFVDPSLLDLEDALRALGRQVRDSEIEPAQVKAKLSALIDRGKDAGQMVATDMNMLNQSLPERLKLLSAYERTQLRGILAEETVRLDVVREKISELSIQMDALNPAAADLQESLADANRQMLVLLRGLSVTQTIVRSEMIPLQPFDVDLNSAVTLAMDLRLDLMNRRAQVVDARRNLEFVADRLEEEVNLVGEAELRTRPLGLNDNPFDFRAKDSQFAVGVQFDTPLDRRAERNDFRAAQIALDQARRGYYGSEDNIKLSVRQSVRTLEQLANTLVQRVRRVQFSARELDLAEKTTDPSRRGLSINNALRTLNRAQDELIEVWLDYETTRLNLYRDMGTMEIDERGFWNDEFYQSLAKAENDDDE